MSLRIRRTSRSAPVEIVSCDAENVGDRRYFGVMFERDLSVLDADATLLAAREARAIADRAETRLLEAAAHWADLHGVVEQSASSLPGMEQLLLLGGVGTPEVAEFAPAELGAELAMSPFSAGKLVGDALDLRHRLPRLWGRVLAGEVRRWIGRKTAEATRNLSLELAGVVDRRVTPWAHSLSWGRLEAIISGVVIAADPQAAAEAARRAEDAQGVWVGQSTEHGIKSIYIRTEAPNAIWFDASVDRIADGLGLLGDTRAKDVRRGRAVGVLAQPQRTLELFEQTRALAASDSSLGPADISAPASDEQPGPSGGGSVVCRPLATLYVHVSQDALARDEGGVARFEGLGPITIDQARNWLGHCHVTVKPVIDLADQIPVDAYEIPERLREAVHLRGPVDVFPYAANSSRRGDIDHTIPYVDPVDNGPPGQTRLDALGPMTRFHHRIKTHSRWQVKQPFNGVFCWRSPHGSTYLVDSSGTRRDTSAA